MSLHLVVRTCVRALFWALVGVALVTLPYALAQLLLGAAAN